MKKRSEWPIKESPTNRQQWFFKWVIQFTKSTILLNLGPANKKKLRFYVFRRVCFHGIHFQTNFGFVYLK